MRILYHHRTQGRGAEGNHIVSIVTALRALGHTVDVLSPPGVNPFSAASTIPVDKARTQTSGWASAWKFISLRLPNWLFEMGEIFYNIPAFLRLHRALRRGSYDLVFERYAFFMVSGAVAARLARCRFLLEANEVCGVPDRARQQTFTRLCRAFERHLIRRCTIVHTVSSYLGDRLARDGLPATRLVVAPNGFDIHRIQLSRSRDSIREQLGVGTSCVIGTAGWFDSWDRLDFLLDVFERLAATHPNVRLCLVGDGPALADISARLQASSVRDKVILTGAVPRSQVYDYIQAFDIGLLPHSNRFGSPIIMFEMMGLKVPLVVPQLPPILDVHSGDATASTFAPLDLEDCTRALELLVTNPARRTEMARAAYCLLVGQYSWRCTATRIMDAYAAGTRP